MDASPPILLPPDQEGSADALIDLLIAIARRVVAEQASNQNVLELPNQEQQKQAA